MTRPVLSTIAQMLYPSNPAIDFARIVGEIEGVLARLKIDGAGVNALEIQREQEDIVYFDIRGTRILLSSVEVGRGAQTTCLTLSVGPATDHGPEVPQHAVICSRLVEHILRGFPPTAVVWQEIEGLVNSGVISDLFGTLPKLTAPPRPARPGNLRHRGALLPPLAQPETPPGKTAFAAMMGHAGKPAHDAAQSSTSDLLVVPPRAPWQNQWLTSVTRLGRGRKRKAIGPVANTATRTAPQPQAAGPASARIELPKQPQEHDAGLGRMRDALYPTDAAAYNGQSTQMRLTAHCFNATLICVWMPLGAAVMTYSILKGEDIRMSARLMAVVGLIVAFSHSPYGDAVKAMAGV